MKAAVYRGPGIVEWSAWPDPTAGLGELLLRVRGCGLCGSDIVKIQEGRVAPPAVFGHEVVGEVVATHRLPLSQLAEGVKLALSRQALKVFLTGTTP